MFGLKPLFTFILIFLLPGLVPLASQDASESKPIAAVLDLTAEEISESEARAVTNLLIAALHGTDLVQIIDRNQREEILSEISFSLSGCADDSCALEIGKMLAADLLITGSLARVGSRVSIELKALSVEEGSILETTFKLFDSVDEVVDNIDSVGATLLQNVTGRRAAQREVLEYEDLVTLTILSDTEDAIVSVNGSPVGRIKDGRLTKALNRNIDVVIEMTSALCYPATKEIYLDEDLSVQLNLEPHYPVDSALKITAGAGTMGSVSGRSYFIPALFFLDLGLGFTVQDSAAFYLKSMLHYKLGVYFANENSIIRPWGGLSFMTPFFDYIRLPDGNPLIRIFGVDFTETEGSGISYALYDWEAGLVFGLDFCVSRDFYLGIEADLLYNLGVLSVGPEEILNVIGPDPALQFGVSATFNTPVPFISNHPDSMNIKGADIVWKKHEYIPDFFTGYTEFLSAVEAEPGLAPEVGEKIKEYRDMRDILGIASIAAPLTLVGLVAFTMVAESSSESEDYNTQDLLIGLSAVAFGSNIIIPIISGATALPRDLVNSYNLSIGGAE